jgi:hypothetical protein
MSTALARSVDVTNFDTLDRLSNVLARAVDACPKAFFGKPATVAAVILFGQEVGLTPMMALRSVHVISGKMVMSAELMLTLALQRGVKAKWAEATNEAATLVLTRNGEEMLPVRFTLADAKTAELLGNPTWKKFPGNMLRARAITNAIRMHCPDVLGPCIYSEEEMRDLEESAPPPSKREIAVAALTRPAVDGQASVAPAGVFLGDLTEAPDSGMRGEETLSAIRHCTTPEKLFAWLEARSKYIRKSEGEVREHITSVLTKMSKRASLELPIVLDRAGLVEASKSIYTGDVVDTTAQRLADNLEAGEDAIRDEQEGDGPH